MNGLFRPLFAFVSLALVLGCSEPHPFYLGPNLGVDGLADAGADTVTTGGDGSGFVDDDAADAAPLMPDGGQTCSPQTCANDFGPAPCGQWACAGMACQVVCPNCQDGDKDGFGVGMGCAGLDCDDSDPNIRTDVASRVCYEGPQGTRGNGSCKAGVAACTAGLWSECHGQQTPLTEACNGEDDDCDGTVDNMAAISCGQGVCVSSETACTANGPAVCPEVNVLVQKDGCGGGDEDCDGLVDEDCDECVRVTATGNDSIANGSAIKPFRSIQAAIDWAHASPQRPQRVCVASGPTCQALGMGAAGKFIQAEGKALLMRNGVSVIGGYQSTTWSVCPVPDNQVVPASAPVLALAHPEGVVFSNEVRTPTLLAGFRIQRAPGAKTSAAITINGAVNAMVSRVAIAPGVKNDVNLGIDIKGQAKVVISHSQVVAGNATQLSVAIRVKESAVELLNNCADPGQNGHCNATCSGEAPGLASGSTDSGGGESFAVLLDATSAGRVSNNSLCAGFGKYSAGVKLQGNSEATTISGNHVHAEGGLAIAAGVWLQTCGGASPWLVNNLNLTASADSDDARVGGVLSFGNCHPRIEANTLIAATGGKGKTNASGILCAAEAGIPSLCQILRNDTISGTNNADPELVVGVRCLDGSCARVSTNKRIVGGHGKRSVGLWLDQGSTRVDRNAISGGCGSLESVGVVARQSGARIDNNLIDGSHCDTDSGAESVAGVRVLVANARRSLDLHSNTIVSATRVDDNDDCTGTALSWASLAPFSGATIGAVRNNIFSQRLCKGAVVSQLDIRSMPRVFEHNLFDRVGGQPLLRADGQTNQTLTEINRDRDGSVRRNNLEGDPMFIAWPLNLRLQEGSAAINKGTTLFAPVLDFDGKPRDPTPDVGAFEK